VNTTCTLITGASSGIGKRLALQLSPHSRLLLCGRNKDKLNEVIHECAQPENHYAWEFDLENPAVLKESLERFLTESQLTIDCFIHCAGMINVAHMKNTDYSSALQLFNINFFSAVEITSVLLKKKVNQARLKNIVFISAILGHFGSKGYNLYSASKAALDGLMKSLAIELAPEIRVNSVLPGGVRTPMSETSYNDPAILQKALHDYPLGIGEPEDIANMVEFLISDKAKWVTGQEIIVDGGRTINISHK
jgi:NAD(P)-dependent dehydrogenase (short-subunit alcohol dehydrogenase family)